MKKSIAVIVIFFIACLSVATYGRCYQKRLANKMFLERTIVEFVSIVDKKAEM